MSNGVIKEIRLKKFRFQGYWRSSEPIRLGQGRPYDFLVPINVPQQLLTYIVPFPRQTAISFESRKFFSWEPGKTRWPQETRVMELPGRERS